MPYVEYIREYVPVQISFLIVEGMKKYSQELIGKPFTIILSSMELNKGKSDWGWWKEDLDIIGKFLVDNGKNKSWLKNHVQLNNRIIEEAKAAAKKVKETDLSKLSKDRLLSLYSDLRIKTERFHALSMEIDALDIELEERLKKRIEQLFAAKREQNEAYAILTTPSELSFPKKEELLLYQIALKFKELISITAKKAELDPKLIKELLEKFWWTELNWRGGKEKTIEDLEKGIREIISATKDIAKHIKQLLYYEKETKKTKERYLKDPELVLLSLIFEEYAVLHDKRKETQMKTTFSVYLILNELADRTNLTLEMVELYTPDELIGLINNKKLDENEIAKRKECTIILIKNNILLLKTSKDAINLRDAELRQDIHDIRDFSGLPASLGKAIGKVKIALSAAEALKKIEKGDILVTGMTLPDFVPAMKKAAAIITNEGGATCHAAIISREFNIPCIVGTKIATKILKDGMLVEVNANHGVVKIVK